MNINPTSHLQSLPFAPELCAALERVEAARTSTLRPVWLETITQIAKTLGGDERSIRPFVEAWQSFYSVTVFLDHVQDGDALGDSWLEAQPPALQYHLAFSTYVAAQYALSRLSPEQISHVRIYRLHAFWATSVAQIANGQYRDLAQMLSDAPTKESPLDTYEQIAAQKTGATFALSFGGAAMLASDNEAVIAALTATGMIYGMLLQYSDDLTDREAQEVQPQALTLDRALAATEADASDGVRWAVIFDHYAQAMRKTVAPLPQATKAVIDELVQTSFGSPVATSADGAAAHGALHPS
jgi:hypothetical protein